MWLPFFLENLHFALSFMAGLIFFAMFWLYYDAWSQQRRGQLLLMFSGLLLLALSYILEGTLVNLTRTPLEIAGLPVIPLAIAATRLPAYLIIIIGLWRDPLPRHPDTHPFHERQAASHPTTAILGMVFTLPSALIAVSFAYPILAVTLAWLYLRRGTIGLERHLQAAAIGFFFIGVSATAALARLWQESINPSIQWLVAPYSVFWWIEHGALLIAIIILGRWVWTHMLKRPHSQLFMVFISVVLASFLIVTVSFTALLINNVQNEVLEQLATNGRVLRFALDSKRAEVISDAQVLAHDSQVIEAVANRDEEALTRRAQDYLLTKRESLLVITDTNGRVVARGEQPERRGDSLSSDALIQQALLGQEAASAVVTEGAAAPTVSVRAAIPIARDNQVIGAVSIGTVIDTAFVEGVKDSTGLDAAVYGHTTLAATTVTGPDGTSRYIGTQETNNTIIEQVISNGDTYTGATRLFSTPYFASYTPLFGANGATIGMLFIGKPQISVLATAARSVELTFIVTAVLMIAAIIPAYFIARSLAYQLH